MTRIDQQPDSRYQPPDSRSQPPDSRYHHSGSPERNKSACSNISAVGVDLDNTLYEHGEFVEGAYRAAAALVAARAGIPEEAFFDRIFSDWKRLTSDCSHLFSDALRDYNLFSADLEKAMVNAYRSHRPASLNLYPGVSESLKLLKGRGIRLGLLTDGNSGVQRHKVLALGLADLFDVEIYTGDLGQEFYKPHQRGFELLIAELGAPATRTAYIGDNPRCDFYAATAAGMRAIRVLTGEYRAHPHDPEWNVEVYDSFAAATNHILSGLISGSRQKQDP